MLRPIFTCLGCAVPIETPSTREIAEFLKLLLSAQWIGHAAIIAWADSVLVSEPVPDPALIDISMSGSRPIHEVFSALGEVQGSLRPEIPVQILVAYLGVEYEAGRKNSTEITHRLHYDLSYRLDFEAALPEHVARSIAECDILIDTISYIAHGSNMPERWKYGPGELARLLKQHQAKTEPLERELDQKLREILEWGRPYRDAVPVQCFPPDSTS